MAVYTPPPLPEPTEPPAGVEVDVGDITVDETNFGTFTTPVQVAIVGNAAAVVIAAASAGRRGLVVQNVGANAVKVGGSNVDATHGLTVAPGGAVAFSAPTCPVGDVHAWAADDTTVATAVAS